VTLAIVVGIASIVGTAIACVGLLPKVIEWKREGWPAKITLGLGFPAWDNRLGETSVILTVANLSHSRALTVNNVGFDLPNKEQLIQFRTYMPLPTTLRPGESYTTWFPVKELQSAMKENNFSRAPRRAWATDGIGRRHYRRVRKTMGWAFLGTREKEEVTPS
jgi:hypothetical protein